MHDFENWYHLQRQVDALKDEIAKLKRSLMLAEAGLNSKNNSQTKAYELGWGKGADE